MKAFKTHIDDTLFQSFIDVLKDPLVLIREDFTIDSYNKPFSKIFLSTEANIIGENFELLIIKPEYKIPLRNCFASLKFKHSLKNQHAESLKNVEFFDNKLGKYDLLISLVSHNSEIYYSIEFKKAEPYPESYEDILNFYQDIIDNLPIDVAICDAERRYLYVNPKAVKNPEQRAFLIGKTDFDYFSALGRNMDIAETRKIKFDLAKSINGLVAWYDEITDLQGKKHHILRNWYPISDDSGELKYMIGFGIDLTDQEVLRKDLLLQSNIAEKYKKATEEGTILSITNTEGHFTYVNQNFCNVSGYSTDQILGQHYSFLFKTGEKAPPFNETIKNYFSSKDVWRGEVALQNKDNQTSWLLTTVIPGVDINGFITEYFQISIDINDQKNAEHVLSRSNEDLEKLVQGRTAEIFQANKDLAAYNHMVSHDLQAPLRRLSGFARILLKKHASSLGYEVEELLNFIEKDAKYMSELCSGLLNLARLSKAELDKKQFDMNEIVRSCKERLEIDKKFSTSFIIHKLGSDFGDEILIRQVWQNLIQNAIKYSSKKENPLIEILSFINNGKNIYCIRDNGCGFPPECKERIFGTFQKLHNFSEYEGIGIGLSTVKKIIEKHGGSVWACSKEGEWSEFYFTLS